MSIINEALKKAEESQQRKKEKIPFQIKETEIPRKPKVRETGTKRFVILGILCLGILSISAIIISLNSVKKLALIPSLKILPNIIQPSPNLLKTKQEASPNPVITKKQFQQKPKVYLPLPQKSSRSYEQHLPILFLEGIVWSEGNPLALIDNKVLGEGDKIKGAKIIKITPKEVKFVFQSKKFVLRIH